MGLPNTGGPFSSSGADFYAYENEVGAIWNASTNDNWAFFEGDAPTWETLIVFGEPTPVDRRRRGGGKPGRQPMGKVIIPPMYQETLKEEGFTEEDIAAIISMITMAINANT